MYGSQEGTHLAAACFVRGARGLVEEVVLDRQQGLVVAVLRDERERSRSTVEGKELGISNSSA